MRAMRSAIVGLAAVSLAACSSGGMAMHEGSSTEWISQSDPPARARSC